jgi:hypothetical protein
MISMTTKRTTTTKTEPTVKLAGRSAPRFPSSAEERSVTDE